jgi:hypothetical protein
MKCFGQCKRIVEEQTIGLEEKVLNLEKCFEQCRQFEERIKKLEEEFHGVKVENIKIGDDPNLKN